MEEPDQKRIKRNLKVIILNVRPQDITDFLCSREVINLDVVEMTTLPALTTREKMIKLLKELFRVKNAFPVFCEALIDADMQWLVQKIKNTDLSQDDSPQDSVDARELELQEKFALQERILQQQTQFIETLIQQTKENKQNGASTPSISEMSNLKSTMKDLGLSEEQVIEYIDDLVKRKSDDSVADDTDSTAKRKSRTVSETAVNFTETVAITTAVDVVKYLAYSDDPSKEISKPNMYQATMRRTVDELISRHRHTFEPYISNESSLRQTTGINFLIGVADEIFRDGQRNWGRIVALYAFGGWLAKHGIFERQDDVLTMIGDVLGFYVANNLGEWIDSSGGWDSFLTQFSTEASKRNSNYWGTALVGLGLALGTGAVIAIASRQ